MTKRLLTELFPHFVKKAQTQRLAKGPFGEGLLEKQGKRVYLKPGEQAPEGANVQTGARGGQYYDEPGGGGAATPDEAQMYPGEVGMKPGEGGFGGATEDPGGYDIDYGDPERAAQVREDLDQQGIGVPPAPEPGPEISQDRNVVGGIDYGPAAATDEDGFPAGASPTGEERRAKRDEAQMYPSEVGMKPGEGGFGSQTSPPDVSEPTFDGQGNIQTPGSDPYPISELTGSDKEAVNSLGEQYQQEGGSNPAELLSGYDGPLTEDGINQYLSDKAQYDDAFISDNDYYNAIDFASWVGEKAGMSDTQKMMKMMQKYNVNNKRRDPIVLSNKGGSQR